MHVREEERYVWLYGALFGIACLFVWMIMKVLPSSAGDFQNLFAVGTIAFVSVGLTRLLILYLRSVHARYRRSVKPMEEAMWDQTLLVKGLTRRIDASKDTKDTVVYRLCAGLREPIKRLQWNVDNLLLSSHAVLPPSEMRTLREAQEAGQTIARSVAKLVTLLDIQEGRGKIRLESVDPAALVRAVHATGRQAMDHRGLTFRLSLPKRSLPDLMMDRPRIRECLEVFLENARGYTPQGGTVTLALLGAKSGIRISVTDTGIGISGEDLKRIWEKFYRAPSAVERMPDGTGAGLAIVKYFVEAHGGSVGCSSRRGKGSVFWMDLPLVPVKANPPPKDVAGLTRRG